MSHAQYEPHSLQQPPDAQIDCARSLRGNGRYWPRKDEWYGPNSAAEAPAGSIKIPPNNRAIRISMGFMAGIPRLWRRSTITLSAESANLGILTVHPSGRRGTFEILCRLAL